MTIIAAADGSALGNPGPAGWAWYIDKHSWAAGGWPHGTNNMGELTAVLDLLRQTAHLDEDLLVYCDSQYVINSITKWMAGWKRNGWKKRDRTPVLNVDLMKALDAEMGARKSAGRAVRFEWVKGHAGHPLNEAADRRANAAAVAYQQGRAPESGPGMPGFSAEHRPAGCGPASRAASVSRAAPVTPAAPVGGSAAPPVQPDLFSGIEEVPESPSTPISGDDFTLHRVIALERALLTDEVRGDRSRVSALLHPDWQEIGASGRLWTRAEMLADIGPISATTLEVVSVAWVDVDTVLLLWRSASNRGSQRRSSVWLRHRGQWRQRFHQGTPEP